MTIMSLALELTDVHIRYRKNQDPILKGVNLALPTGELLAVLGPSGCGKTTMLRIMAGLLRADQGTMKLGNQTVFSNDSFTPPERRRVGLVPQDAALFPHLSVAQNIAFGLTKHPDKQARVAEMLELVAATELKDRKPAELSGGQAQRIALARALAPAPSLILLDEPFAALDAALRVRLRNDIRSILNEAKASAILVTHDQDEALSMADRIAVMHRGSVIQCGTPQEVYDQPATAWVADFLGTCTILDDGRVLRPEHVNLASPSGSDEPRGTITSIEYLGHSTMFRIAGLGTQLSARCLGAPKWQIGDEVALVISEDAHRVSVDSST